MTPRKLVHGSVGNFNIDVAVYLDQPPIPGEGVFARDVSIRPGGAATNYAVAASSYGHEAYLVASLSSSPVAKPFIQEVVERGVKLDYVKYVDENPGLVVVLVYVDGEKSMIRYPGANRYLDPSDVSDFLISKLHVLHFASIQPSFVLQVVTKAKSEPVIVSYDPGPYAEDLPRYPAILEHVDVLFFNEPEFTKVTRYVPLATLLRKGPRCIVVKRGARGALVFEGEDRCYHGVAEPIRKPVDTTGAGDAFDAFFNAVYVETADVAKALLYGVAAGTFKTICKSSFICWDPRVFELQLEKTSVSKTSCGLSSEAG